jgi:isopentenyl diphosphate isomerase/L-lactate dehydrogenase-like FMN-dependent dehydrogenase
MTAPLPPARARQLAIYIDGVGGKRPRLPTRLDSLEREAERVMTPRAWGYVAGGAGTGATMRANRAAFDRWQIVPRMMVDASARDLSTTLFGRTIPAPLLLGPVGVLEMMHPDADLAVARAARATGTPMIVSNQASVPLEPIAQTLGDTLRLFQLYWSTSNDLVASFAARAERAGYSAIVVTLDTTMLGWRTHDLDLAYLPFIQGLGIAQYTSDPVFLREMRAAAPPPARTPPLGLELIGALATLWRQGRRAGLSLGEMRRAAAHFTATYSRPSLQWSDLAFLRSITKLPIVLKGIQHPDDARRALDAGVDGIVVSNHGGRQVDGAIGSLDALPAVVQAVSGATPVLFDSGVRTGADVFKAVALGATAVLLGRPFAYALAIDGEAGVRDCLANVVAELDLTMGLSGQTSVRALSPDLLRCDH